MNDWFEFNGVKCTEYGMHVSEHPVITFPSERVTFTDVPGRNGSLTTLEGEQVYSDMTLTATCFISDVSRINEIAAYLKGSGKVTFANRQGGFYYGRIINQIPFDMVMRGKPNRTFAVNFRVKPFFYLDGDFIKTITASEVVLTNPGCIHSEPIITIYGSGEITLMVGAQIVELEGVTDSITLDTPLMEAYNGEVNMNSCMSGDFPTFSTGAVPMAWTGDVSKVVIQPNWRTL